MKDATAEAAVLAACLDVLRVHGVYAWRSNNAGVYDPARGRFRAFRGLKGVSDILGCLIDGRFLAVEVKGPKGRLTEEQKYFLDTVRRLGGLSLCVRSAGELHDALAAEGY